MKTIYKILKLCFLFLLVFNSKTQAQNCIQSSQYPSGTTTITSGGTTNITTCNYAGEYSVNSFTATGNYIITSTGGAGNYLTITDNSNNPLASGYAPLGVAIPSVGVYRIHISLNTACGTDFACHNVSVSSATFCNSTSQYPSGTTNINSSGGTTITTCNYAGEYSVNTFSANGTYTIGSTGGTGNYITVKNAAGTIIYAQGVSPIVFTPPSNGNYYVHIALAAPSSCGTDFSCHTVTVTAPGAPPAPPANDLCVNSTSLAVPSNTAGTTVNATAESPAPGTCITTLSQPGVWYRVVGNGNQFGADLCAASSWDSKIFVYTGSCGAWSCVTGNDDAGPMCPSSAAASVTWCSVPSTTYYILVTGYSSANAFTIAVTQTVNASNPTVTAVAASNSVCLTSTTALTASGASTYSWSTGATSASIAVTPTANTVYTVIGRAAAGCGYDIKTVTITSLPNPSVTISANSASICPGGSFAVTASGAISYTFNGSPSGTVVATGSSATLSPIVNTTYTVYGTASNGCRSLLANSPTATVTTLASPTLVVSASPSSVCPGATSTLSVSGANTYTWISPSSNSSSIAVSPSSTTIYTVSGTGTNVCNGFKTVTVTTYPTPTITVNSGTSCAGSTFTMVPSGASTYTFSNGSNTVAPTTSSSYSVTGTSAQGCLATASAVANVSVTALPVVSVNSGSICQNTPFYIIPSGATSYTIIGASNPVNPSVTTSYSVIGSNTAGCISQPAVSTVTVYALPALTVVSTPSDNVICNNSPYSLSVSGASTYTWNGTVSGTSISSTPSVSGSNYVIGTDTNGCVNVATVPFTVNPQPALTLATTNTFLCAGASATMTAAGANSYTWTDNSNGTSLVITPSVSGIYGVTGDNSFGCTKTLTLSINVNTIVMTVSSNTAICEGASIQLTASGANSYTWTGSNTPFGVLTVTPNTTTTYSVTGKDAKGCYHSGAITVTVNTNPTVLAGVSPATICLGETATLTASGANSYVWSITSSTNNTGSPLVVTPSNASTIHYIVTGTDEKDCVAKDTVSLMVDKCTGIQTISKASSAIRVFPNPNNGTFSIEFANGANKSVEISDVTGRIVSTLESVDDIIEVNLQLFANGIYYAKVKSGSTLEIIKVIKQ